MLRDLWLFSRAFWKHWRIVLTSSGLIAVTEIWALAGRRAPPQSMNWLILALTLIIASFRAWQQEYRRANSLMPVPTGEVEQRIWIKQSIEQLMELRRGNTKIVTDKLVAPYLGKWLKVQGNIDNVRGVYKSVVVDLKFPRVGPKAFTSWWFCIFRKNGRGI